MSRVGPGSLGVCAERSAWRLADLSAPYVAFRSGARTGCEDRGQPVRRARADQSARRACPRRQIRQSVWRPGRPRVWLDDAFRDRGTGRSAAAGSAFRSAFGRRRRALAAPSPRFRSRRRAAASRRSATGDAGAAADAESGGSAQRIRSPIRQHLAGPWPDTGRQDPGTEAGLCAASAAERRPQPIRGRRTRRRDTPRRRVRRLPARPQLRQQRQQSDVPVRRPRRGLRHLRRDGLPA